MVKIVLQPWSKTADMDQAAAAAGRSLLTSILSIPRESFYIAYNHHHRSTKQRERLEISLTKFAGTL